MPELSITCANTQCTIAFDAQTEGKVPVSPKS